MPEGTFSQVSARLLSNKGTQRSVCYIKAFVTLKLSNKTNALTIS